MNAIDSSELVEKADDRWTVDLPANSAPLTVNKEDGKVNLLILLVFSLNLIKLWDFQ